MKTVPFPNLLIRDEILFDRGLHCYGTAGMKRTALLATRDPSGVVEFARKLVETFDYQLITVESLAPSALLEECETVDFAYAEKMIRDGGVSLVVANFASPTIGGHRGHPWKKALAEMDHEIVGLIRGAALNPVAIGVVGDSRLYSSVVDLLAANQGRLPEPFRVQQACDALHAVAVFDAAVAQFLESQSGETPDLDALSGYPKTLYFSVKRDCTLQGVAAHQKAAIYGRFSEHFELLSGPEPDYACLLDLTLATFAIGEFEKPTALLVSKGQLLAGSSSGQLSEALQNINSEEGEDRGASMLVVNGALDYGTLEKHGVASVSSIVAPNFLGFDDEPGIRLVASKEGLGYESLQEIRSIAGGWLVQDKNRIPINPMTWRIVSSVQPLVDDWETMMFGVKIVRHLQSSACLAVSQERVVRLASHMTSQLDFEKAFSTTRDRLENAIFVFDEDLAGPDSLEAAQRLGASLVIHPGLDGNREPELVDHSNELGIGLVATGSGLAKL
ncbi:MAG: hypothetical protein CMI15_15055 [Opitutaceae bacterium]|nr:hypothetical protein [Opitutaceae bacterium]